MLTPFHLAIQVRDVAEAREFYGTKMGLPEGRSDSCWVDYDLFGHQLVVHLNPDLGPTGKIANYCNPVDDHAVPVPHFGVVLEVEAWKILAERVRTFVEEFIIEPYVRFEGQPGEQHTMFFEDPAAMHSNSKPLPTSSRSCLPSNCTPRTKKPSRSDCWVGLSYGEGLRKSLPANAPPHMREGESARA